MYTGHFVLQLLFHFSIPLVEVAYRENEQQNQREDSE